MTYTEKTGNSPLATTADDLINAIHKDPGTFHRCLRDFCFGVETYGQSFALTTTDEVLPVTVRVLKKKATGKEESKSQVHGPLNRYGRVVDGSPVMRYGVAYMILDAMEPDRVELVTVRKALLAHMLAHPESEPLVRRSRGQGKNLTLWRRDLAKATSLPSGMTLHSFPADRLLAS